MRLKEKLELIIKSKKGMKKRIYQLENDIKEAKDNEKYAIEQMNKYKKKYRELKRKEENICK